MKPLAWLVNFNGDVKWAEGISGDAVKMAGKAGKAGFYRGCTLR